LSSAENTGGPTHQASLCPTAHQLPVFHEQNQLCQPWTRRKFEHGDIFSFDLRLKHSTEIIVRSIGMFAIFTRSRCVFIKTEEYVFVRLTRKIRSICTIYVSKAHNEQIDTRLVIRYFKDHKVSLGCENYHEHTRYVMKLYSRVIFSRKFCGKVSRYVGCFLPNIFMQTFNHLLFSPDCFIWGSWTDVWITLRDTVNLCSLIFINYFPVVVFFGINSGFDC